MKRSKIIIVSGLLVFTLIIGIAIFNMKTIAAFVANVAAQMHLMENGPAMVRIPGKDYKIGKYEVTQKEWRDIMGGNPSEFITCGDNCPVEKVSWNDAQRFIKKLNAKTGRHYRLPTEVEWEYACFGGNKSEYCGGDSIDTVAWYGKTYLQPKTGNSSEKSHPVAQKLPNGYGLFDMSGNVKEWTSDYYRGDNTLHVLRGGSWNTNFVFASASYSSGGATTVRLNTIGFRLAESINPSSDKEVAINVPDTDEDDSVLLKNVASTPSNYYIEEIEGGDEDGNTKRLIANLEGEELKGPAAPQMTIEKEIDLNGDGVMDALVMTSGGGNCCPEDYMVVSVQNGEVVASALDSEWGGYAVVEENGQMFIKHIDDDATIYYKYSKNFEVVEVRTIKQRVLKTVKEIRGEGNLYSGTDLDRSLRVDLNNDGKKEEITCLLWSRWGTLTGCTLPLPDGSSQSWEQNNCHRFGVLSTSRNGYREMVCDNNTVIYFDGKKWVTDNK